MQGTGSPRPKSEAGSVLLIALLLMVLLSLLGLTLLTLSSTEYSIAYNALWSEGALAAADAGVNTGINKLSANLTNSTAAIPATKIPVTDNASPYSFRSGRKTDTTPQAIPYVGSRTESGYSIAVGTGYNPAGYVFQTYQINATGTFQGPRNAMREVEVQAEYGPVAQ